MGFLPGIDVGDIKPALIALVVGIILLVVGAVSGTISVAVGKYIIGTLNNTGGITITSSENFINSVTTVVGPTFTIAGIVLIVISVAMIIKVLLESTKGFGV